MKNTAEKTKNKERKKKIMTSDIFFWTRHGEAGYLSNFHRSPIKLLGEEWPTVEHFYQAMKTIDPNDQEMIRKLETPKEAKFAGAHVTLRRGWEEEKEKWMLLGLYTKFSQHPDLKEQLLATGDAVLHENSPWDKYWGYVEGRGKDRLGQLLMQVREDLRNES